MSDDVRMQPDPQADVGEALLRTGFHVEPEGGEERGVIRLQGELDMATAETLKLALAEALEAEPRHLALDLSDLTFIDSTGIGVLVSTSRRAEERGCSFVLRSPCRPVLRALRLTGVDQLLAIEDDEAAR